MFQRAICLGLWSIFWASLFCIQALGAEKSRNSSSVASSQSSSVASSSQESSSPGNLWREIPLGVWTTQVGGEVPGLSLTMQDKKQGTKLDYEPNVRGKAFGAVGYGPYAISASTADGKLSDDPKIYGTTKDTDFQFKFYGEVWTPELTFQQYQGYYLKNTSQVDPSASGIILRPDINLTHYAAVIYYNLHPDQFHPSGAFDLFAQQRESGGSSFLIGGLEFLDIRGDSPFVPPNVVASYPFLSQVNHAAITASTFGYAGSYIWTRKKYFVGGLLGIGASLEDTTFSGANLLKNSSSVATKIFGKWAIGYNGERFHADFGFTVNALNANSPDGSITVTDTSLLFFVGWRFGDLMAGAKN